MGVLPIPETYMPNDVLASVRLNRDLKLAQASQFQPARAKLAYTGAASIVSGTQPLALGWDAAGGRGVTVYDDAFNGSKLVNTGSPGANGFQIQIPGKYRIRARMSWQYISTAASGVRYLGLYQAYNGNFVAAGSPIGNPATGAFGDSTAVQWDYCRFVNGAPCTAKIDITIPLIQGACLQLGISQNSTVTLNYQTSSPYIWFSCTMVA
jgi:hypothetical protein